MVKWHGEIMIQKEDLMRFFEVMRGTRIAPPSKLLPVMNIPL